MQIRTIIRKTLNKLGYDVHRQVFDDSAIFDPNAVNIRQIVKDGIQVKLFVADKLDVIQSHHDKGKFYEEDMLEVIAKNFSVGECFVDIGANVGNHSLFVAKHLQPSKVIAIEPMRLQHSILVLNMTLNNAQDMMAILKFAASDHDGTARMITPNPRNIGRSMIADATYGEDVRLKRGDDLLAGEEVHFIKIDVEGHELSTLAGLEKTITRCRPRILIEVNERNMDNFLSWTKDHNYEISKKFKHYRENTDVFIAPKREL